MGITVYNQSGKETGEMELPKEFLLPWNADLVHQVVTGQQANRRRGTAHTKGRGEVSGGGRKPWVQKGTGRARHGSIRSPIWRKGGVTHGPKVERNFKRKVNKKMAARALATVLSAKVKDGECIVLEEVRFAQPKTKEAAKVFQNLAKIKDFSDLTKKENRALLVLPRADENVRRAARNLPFLVIDEARKITALDVISRKYIVLPKESVTALAERIR